MKTGRKIIHGFRVRGSKRPKEYVSWDHMIGRCHRPKHNRYKDYGAKGITVCERWRKSFGDFLEDVGFAPSSQHTLDRYPNKAGNYEPGNVRWATKIEQSRNTKRNRMICYKGQTKAVCEWSELLGLNASTIIRRVDRYGWTTEEALQIPTLPTGMHKPLNK